MTSWLSLFFFFFSSHQVPHTGHRGWRVGEAGACGRRKQWEGEGRGILGLVTFLGVRENCLFIAVWFTHKFFMGSWGCPYRLWHESASLKLNRDAWETEKLRVRSCSSAALQNIASISGSGSQLGSVSERLLHTDASPFCDWAIMVEKAVDIKTP